MNDVNWPYPVQWDEEEYVESDLLVLGGGVSGCMAAIAAAEKGCDVVLVEKGSVRRSGAGGSGCDHWEHAATNPCSKISPEELTAAMLDDNDGYNNAISHYIECREGYDRLLDIESMGGKIRDSEGDYIGSLCRDEKTGFLFAYDCDNRFTLRVWGTTFKPAMHRRLKELGVRIYERVMTTSFLTEKGQIGQRVTGATGLNTRTGKFYVFNSKATVLCTSRPSRIWLFSSAYPGLSEFRPTQCVGDGHAMGWRSGAEFAMMEKSVRAEFSAAGKSYPPYGAGNNHNTWYPASIIDGNGKEIPYKNRDGQELHDFSDRFRPAPNQKFFLMGGNVEEPNYEYKGPEVYPDDEDEHALPLYADLSGIPEIERRIIWGLMIGEEGKTKIPVYDYYTKAGFDPSRHVLQCYGSGWKSASFMPDERQLFGLSGGFMNDWSLGSSLEGLYVAGDVLFASNCFGHAAATGHYAGRHAADYATRAERKEPYRSQVEQEKLRIYGPLKNDCMTGIDWRELNEAIAKTMRLYCGEEKRDDLLNVGLRKLGTYETDILPRTFAGNPHELTRLLEVHNILTVSQLVLHSCLARTQSSAPLNFFKVGRSFEEEGRLIVVSNTRKGVQNREVPLDYYGSLEENYERYNAGYIRRRHG